MTAGDLGERFAVLAAKVEDTVGPNGSVWRRVDEINASIGSHHREDDDRFDRIDSEFKQLRAEVADARLEGARNINKVLVAVAGSLVILLIAAALTFAKGVT